MFVLILQKAVKWHLLIRSLDTTCTSCFSRSVRFSHFTVLDMTMCFSDHESTQDAFQLRFCSRVLIGESAAMHFTFTLF